MAATKAGSSNVQHEDFEPFCQWKRLEDSDVLEVHLQEFKKEELKVRIINNSLLSLSGERLTANDGKKIQFKRDIKLPKDVNRNQIRAKFGGSVLSITIPKKVSAEIDKPKSDASEATKLTASNDNNAKPKNFISGLKTPLSRLKFSMETSAAMAVVTVVILAFGAYYLIKN